MSNFVEPLIGGALIGLGAFLLMFLNGRIAGISGILGTAISSFSEVFNLENLWRWSFLLGLVIAPIFAGFWGYGLPQTINLNITTIVIAGVCVGVGTQLGSGCTSGHGICGIGRLSLRSLVATITFMVSGILVVALVRHLF